MTSWTADLDALPRLSLVTEPTPLTPACRLSAALGGPQLWFKRDDLLPFAFAMTGLRCIAIYWGVAPPRAEGNHWLTRMLGAEIVFTGDVDRASVDSGIEASAAEVVAQGGRPFRVPRGGACALGVLAHVLAVRETLEQCAVLGIMPRAVIMAVGGAGTLAGWLLGTALFGAVWRLEAITVSRPAIEALTRARKLAAEAAAMLDCRVQLSNVELCVHDGFLGAGYGVPTARAEGVFLVPTYTGKAMAGYSALLSQGRYAGANDVLFLHTGGAPGLFTAAVEEMP